MWLVLGTAGEPLFDPRRRQRDRETAIRSKLRFSEGYLGSTSGASSPTRPRESHRLGPEHAPRPAIARKDTNYSTPLNPKGSGFGLQDPEVALVRPKELGEALAEVV